MSASASSRVAVVTGAGSGIGHATARELGRRGWRLALIGRTPETLERTASEIRAQGGADVLCAPADVTRADEVGAAFDLAHERFGRVDLLFNNAGSFGPQARVDELSDEDWAATLAVNVTGALHCAREAFRRMRAQSPQGGRIINNGSVSAHRPRPRSAAYAITKHAVTGLTRSIACKSLKWLAWGRLAGWVLVLRLVVTLESPGLPLRRGAFPRICPAGWVPAPTLPTPMA
ncbi:MULTISPECIES: SDR family oxidoreductase [Microbacterium]|uniref:SDR family oxidoreductase n=1 Tax=Microbacterium TaxID=33882 RepID=UPI00217D0A7F|nr:MULTISPECIES: SDR family oxidoreductase [Microbacterium]UWF77107.1 SDR family oxidoreductase [Microbacterium neungamense]WCM55267.1 SDR family oxidoreductase [Microbacterium sp. EF45047]